MKFFFIVVISFSFFVEANAQPDHYSGLKKSLSVHLLSNGDLFYMDETPVTYEDFEKYVRAGGEKNAYWYYESYHIKNQPVTGISWFHAIDYCNWRSKCEGFESVYYLIDSLDYYGYPIYEIDLAKNGYRLPFADELSWAAKGPSQSSYGIYPWGNQFYDDKKNDYRSNIDLDSGMKSTDWWRLSPVKSQYKNGYGLYNVCGNIWHWCSDWQKENATKKLKGGGWGVIDTLHATYNYTTWCTPGNYNYDIGFRCVKNNKGITDSIIHFDTTVQYNFYKSFSSLRKNSISDFYGETFKEQLTNFIADNYPECINFQIKVDEQEILTPNQMAELIIKVCQRNKINPLFLVSVMISESGFGTVSFPRWYNNPMAYMWQNKLMENGYPTYENKPGKINRKYKTLEEGFEAFCKGIRRDIYIKAAKKNLDGFHLIYVGYRADEWMNTMRRIYRDIAGITFEAKKPETDAGKYIYTDWDSIKKKF